MSEADVNMRLKATFETSDFEAKSRAMNKALKDLGTSDHTKVLRDGMSRTIREFERTHGATAGLRLSGKHLEEFSAKFRELSVAAQNANKIAMAAIPAMAGIGGAAFSVAGAFAGVVAAAGKFAGTVKDIKEFSQETSLAFNKVLQFDSAARAFHVGSDQMRGDLKGLASQFQLVQSTLSGGPLIENLIKGGASEQALAGRLKSIMRGPGTESGKFDQGIEEVLRYTEALKQAGVSENFLVAKLGQLGIGESFAKIIARSKDLDDLKRKADEVTLRLGLKDVDLKAVKDYTDTINRLSENFEGLGNKIGVEALGPLKALNDIVAGMQDPVSLGLREALDNLKGTLTIVVGLLEKASALVPDVLKQKATAPLRPGADKPIYSKEYGDAVDATINERHEWWMQQFESLKDKFKSFSRDNSFVDPLDLPPVDVDTPQRFADGDFGTPGALFKPDPDFLKDSPMSENIEDRRGYVGDDESSKSALAANTERLAELNRYLDELLHGRPGSGGAQFFTGGAAGGGSAPGAPGSGGLPGLPAGGLGGGGMGGLPGMPSIPDGGAGGPGGVLGSLGAPMGGPGGGTGGGQGRGPGGGGPGGRVQAPGGVGSGTPFEGNPLGGGGGAGGGGAAYLAEQRASQAEELQDPALRERIANIASYEEPGRDGARRVLESLSNRGLTTGKSLRELTKDGPDSFYGPVRKGLPQRGPKPGADMKAVDQGMDDVFKRGSNDIQMRTDQGSPGENKYTPGNRTFGSREEYGYQNAQQKQRAEAMQAEYVKRGNAGTPSAPPDIDAINNTNLGKLNQQLADQRNQTDQMLGPQAVGQMPPNAALGREAGGGNGVGGDVSFAPGGHGQLGGQQLQNVLKYAGGAAGVNTEITSGLERGHSGRHLGLPGQLGAHDVRLRDPKTGELLDMRNPEHQKQMAAYTENAAAAGATGIGAGSGTDYMGPHGIHVGGGPGAETVWGAGGRSANAPQWLRDAYARGRARAMSPEQVQAAIDAQKQAKPPSEFAGKPVPHANASPFGTLPERPEAPQQLAQRDADDGAEPGGFSKPGQFSKAGGYTPIAGTLAAKAAEAQRMEISNKGSIDINVKAARGTSVKAGGDGPLFDTVRLNRTHAGEASTATASANAEE
jgi:hypothetical protein